MSNFLLNMITVFTAFMGEPNTVALTHYIGFVEGSSQYVTVADSADFSALTPMSAMIYTNAGASPNLKGFLTHSTSAGDDRAWRIISSPTLGTLYNVFVNESGTANPRKEYVTTAVFDGDWHQLVFTFSANDLKLYVDGVLRGVTTITDDTVNSIFDSSSALLIGAHNAAVDGFFTGGVTQAAIWNKALSANEIAEIHSKFMPGPAGSMINLKKDQGDYAGSANLKFWARLGNGDTIAASGILDSSGFNNHGSPVNTPTITAFP